METLHTESFISFHGEKINFYIGILFMLKQRVDNS